MNPEILEPFELMNILFRLGIAVIVVIKLYRFFNSYKRDERLGLGIAGGCVLMTIPVIWEGPSSPFAGWAGTMFALGVLVYFGGGLRRKIRHDRANQRAVEQARQHFAGKDEA